MIPFKNRFHGHNSLNYVYKNGQSARSDMISIRYIKNSNRKESRIAVVVGKKILKSAVGRNRIRRRVYGYAHTLLVNFQDSYDLIFIIHSKELKDIGHKDLAQQIDKLLNQAKIL